jgi:predicted ABC-type ATPase
MRKPVCTIIAGVNGAGKTTFALKYLSETAHCRRFINADLIASGLSPLAPELKQMAASRLFLKEIKQAIYLRENFAFETTLSGKSYLSLIRNIQAEGWLVELIYLYLPDVQLSIERVAERVKHGGHDIPLESIIRRYPRSLHNLVNDYAPLCDTVICLDNSQELEKIIFVQNRQSVIVKDKPTYQKIIGINNDDRN